MESEKIDNYLEFCYKNKQTKIRWLLQQNTGSRDFFFFNDERNVSVLYMQKRMIKFRG